MRNGEAIGHLEQLGLSRYEATAFVNLARMGAATASELSQAMGAHRVQTYRALDSLEGRGLVEVTLERPKRYTPRAIAEVFELLIDERRREISAMEQMQQLLTDAWPTIAGPAKESVRLQIIKGRTQVYRELNRAIRGAREEVLAFTTAKGLQRSYRAGINESLLAAVGTGAECRLLLDVQDANLTLARKVAGRVHLRHLDGQRGRFILIDRRLAFTFLIQDEKNLTGEGETALWTNSPDFVEAHLDSFERAWKTATPAKERFAALGGTARPRRGGTSTRRGSRSQRSR